MIDIGPFIGPFITFLTLGAAGLVWCLRLEARVDANLKSIENQQKGVESLQKELEAHNGLAVQIARLEEQMKGLNTQLQAQNSLLRKLVKFGPETTD